MKIRASKEIYSEYFKEYSLDEKLLKKLHETLFEMLCDFKSVCDKYNIKYMLSGGSVLGAVRHKGFIPWDDDIDIMITRENYRIFAKAIKEMFPDKYILVEPLEKDYFFKMPKMFLVGSEYVELATAGTPSYHMIYLDLFIIEYIPNNQFIRRIKSVLYDFAYKASSLCIDYKYPSPEIMNKMQYVPDVKNYYTKRRRIGRFFSHFGGIKLYLKIDNRLASSSKESDYMGIPSGISYSKEVFGRDLYEDLIEMEFEGNMFPIPRNYHEYLKNLYGDNYLEIPSEDKRQFHLAIAIRFPED